MNFGVGLFRLMKDKNSHHHYPAKYPTWLLARSGPTGIIMVISCVADNPVCNFCSYIIPFEFGSYKVRMVLK